jgi:hypothetical protein
MWYSQVAADLGKIPDFMAHYDRELEDLQTIEVHDFLFD